MEISKLKWKKSLFLKTWERCKSLAASGTGRSSSSSSSANENKNSSWMTMTKSKSWNCSSNAKSLIISPDQKDNNGKRNNNTYCQVAPVGCFAVYVGPQKQRFVIKTEFANHPLFKMLLEDAESEYGHECQGPIMLPCDVDLFYKVLAEMGSGDDDRIFDPGCGFAKAGCCSPLILRSPSHKINKGHGQYRLLTPSRMLKMNGV